MCEDLSILKILNAFVLNLSLKYEICQLWPQKNNEILYALLFFSQQSHSLQVQFGQSYGVVLVLHSEARQLQLGHLVSVNISPKSFFQI